MAERQAAESFDAAQERLVREDAAGIARVHDGMEKAGEASLGELIEQPARLRQHVERVQRGHAREVGQLGRRCARHEESARLERVV